MANEPSGNKISGSRKSRTTLDEINEESDIRDKRKKRRGGKNVTTGKPEEKKIKIRSDDA